MMSSRRLVVLLAGALLVATPSAAAVTSRAATPEDTPRVAWLERYQESRQGPEQTENFSKTVKVAADGALDLQNLAGDVRVTTGRGNEIQIEAIKRVRHREAGEGKRLLGELRIEVTQVGNRVEVRTVYPRVRSNGRSLSMNVDFVLTVPVGHAVSLKTISGNVSVAGVRGEVRADTTSGDVQVSGTPNLVFAKTISGDVTARDISSPATLMLGTVSGSVIATALKARALEAGSISGDVQITNLQVERLLAKTVSGNIEFDGTLARGGRYEFNAHSGNVRLMLANPSGFELDASTFSGSVRSDFPVTLRSTERSTGRDNDRRRGASNRTMRGTYGDAGAYLAVRSFSGNVVITKR
jgi:hypothetical protein